MVLVVRVFMNATFYLFAFVMRILSFLLLCMCTSNTAFWEQIVIPLRNTNPHSNTYSSPYFPVIYQPTSQKNLVATPTQKMAIRRYSHQHQEIQLHVLVILSFLQQLELNWVFLRNLDKLWKFVLKNPATRKIRLCFRWKEVLALAVCL